MSHGHTDDRAHANNRNVLKEEVLAEQVRQLYALAPLGFIGTLLNSLIVFFIMKEVVPLRIVLVWLAALFSITFLRVLLVLRFRSSALRPFAARIWGNRFLVGLALSGIVWGSIGVFPLSGISLAHQVLIAFVLGGMAAGAAATYSALKEGYLAFSIPALAPLALQFFLFADSFHYAMGGMLSLYGLLLWRVSLNSYRVNRMSLLLRFENRGMIERLKSAKEHADELNEKLCAEIDAKKKAEAELRSHRNHLETIVEERTTDLLLSNEQLKDEIEERKQTEQALRESEGRLILAQRAGRVGVFDWDLISGKAIWTEQLEELFGLPPGGFEGNCEGWLKRVHPDDRPGIEAKFRQWMRARHKQVEFEYRFIRADGQTRWMAAGAQFSYFADGTPARMIGSNVDITERRRLEEEIRHLAHHDALTGLPNRRLFMDIIIVEVAEARRIRKRLAVLFLDLDRFKEVNDTLGHEAGDELLKEVARRLRANVRESDAVARIGGDEFNIILTNISHVEDITVSARKIMSSFQQPYFIAGNELYMTTSIGISIYPDDNEEVDTLFRYADIAMYHAKEIGKNAYQFYNSAINIRSVERIKMEGALRQTFDRGELLVHYQPQVDIKTREIIGAEALVRWQHPELGLLESARFIPLAEETGLITTIDEWVFRTVCAQLRSWRHAGLLPVSVTINLSARQFQSPELITTVSKIVEETGVPPDCLNLEITESMAMSNVERTASYLKEIAKQGIHISIDDFGTGYSSLNYLKRLPVEKLKIDKSFIQDIATDPDDRAIISAVTAMAHTMRMKVIAEGVETEEQLSFLRSIHCDEGQGYLFSRPLPAEEFRELMGAGSGS